MALAVVGGGSAALIQVFGSSQAEATISNQALTVTGDTSPDYSVSAAPETFADSIQVSNNNEDEAVDYAVDVTQEALGSGDVGDWNTTVFEATSNAQTGNGITVNRTYVTDTNRVAFNITGYSGDTGAFYLSTEGNSTPEIQIGFYDQDATTPRAKVWRNVDGTYTEDTRFDKDSGEFNSDDVFTSGTFDSKLTGFIGKDFVTLRVNASELGTDFQYGVKDNGGSNFNYDNGGTAGTQAADDTATTTETIGKQLVEVTQSATEGTSTPASTIYGTQTQNPEDLAIIQEFGSQTPSDTYNSTVNVEPQ